MVRIINTSYIMPSFDVVQEAYRIIKNCGLVVGITDTLYGVFADPYRNDCVEKVYLAKKRGKKSIPILASSTKAILRLIDETYDKEILEKFLNAIWPGPVTVVLKTVPGILSDMISWERNAIGFRVPAAPLPRKLAELNGGFITGTSANISGQIPAREINEAIRQLGNRIDLYIDSGTAPIGSGSTVIELIDDNLRIIREGPVPYAVIHRIYSYYVEHVQGSPRYE